MTLALAALLFAAAPAFGPFETEAAPLTAEARFPDAQRFERPTDNPLYLAFDVYRYTMTVFDGPRCVHRPVCSVYAMRAVARHGLLGIGLAIDRLWRGDESSALRRLPAHVFHGDIYFDDPLSGSDFWLSKRVRPRPF
ncbi:MAG: membrane protein insertion efficiency factor YidD [Deltaproteobacteria bacterium]